jgi:hypothetical protein
MLFKYLICRIPIFSFFGSILLIVSKADLLEPLLPIVIFSGLSAEPIALLKKVLKVPTHRHEYNVLFKLPPFEADHIPSNPGVNFRLVYQFALLLATEPKLVGLGSTLEFTEKLLLYRRNS